MKKSDNIEKHRNYNHKKKEMDIARENMLTFSSKANIKRKNMEDEDHYLKKFNDTNMRKATKNQNKEYAQHKQREIEVRNFNQNLILTKKQKNDKFEIKNRESQIYGFRNKKDISEDDIVLDPILEGTEKR